jgi:hypothetical protein
MGKEQPAKNRDTSYKRSGQKQTIAANTNKTKIHKQKDREKNPQHKQQRHNSRNRNTAPTH